MIEDENDQEFVDDTDDSFEDDESIGRRWPYIVGVIVVVLVLLAAGVFFEADHYKPISQFEGGAYGSNVVAANGSGVINTFIGSAHVVRWTEPTGVYTVEAVFAINNDGRFPVTIEGASSPGPGDGKTTPVTVYFDATKKSVNGYGPKGGPVFQPVSLGVHGSLELAVHWQERCVPQSDPKPISYSTIDVTYSFLGFRHTVAVPLNTFQIEPRTSCYIP